MDFRLQENIVIFSGWYYQWDEENKRSDSITVNDPREIRGDVEELKYEFIHRDIGGDFIEVPYSFWGNYVGSTVTRSNCEVFWEMFKDKKLNGERAIWKLKGGHCSHGILIRKKLYEQDEEVKEVIDGIFEYTSISDDNLSDLEQRLFEESWEGWIRFDLEYKLNSEEIEYNEETLEEDYYYIIKQADIYYFFEDAISASIDVEEIVDNWYLLSKKGK